MAIKKFTEEEARQRKNARQSEYAKRTGNKSAREYVKEHGKHFSFWLFSPQDDDLINFLAQLPNKTGYLKELIRKDMVEKKDGY